MVQLVFLRAFFFVTASTLLRVQPPKIAESFPHPSCLHNNIPHHIEVLVCPQFVRLPSQHGLDWLQPTTPSNSSHSYFAVHLFQLTILVCVTSIFSHLAGKPLSCPTPPVFQITGCASGHLMLRSRVSHMTAPADPLTCRHVCTSQICFLHAFC